jgi:periplasmic protein TonB
MKVLQELRPSHGKPIEKNRWPGILFAVVIHVVSIYALTTAPSHSTAAVPHENTQAVVFAELPKNYVPPPLLPDFKPPPVVTVLPEIEINLSEVPLPAMTPMRLASPAVVTHAPIDIPSTPPVPITSHAVTSDDYPDLSIRLAEDGLVKIKYLVQSDGTVSECAVITSSGSSRLDVAACTMVKRRWRFRPATQKGKPVAEYLLADVSFTLVPSSDN